MKRFLSLFIAFLMALSCISCASNDADKELCRGKISGNVYTSDFSGITFTAGEGWEFSTDEELASNLAIEVDALAEANFKNTVDNSSTSVYDMIAKSGTNYIHITYQKVPSQELTAKKFLKDSIVEVPGYEYGSFKSKSISGAKYTCVEGFLIGDSEIKTKLYSRRVGDYMIDITVIADTLKISAIEKMF